MKAQISITGQIHGNFVLLNNLSYESKTNGMFNSYCLYYDSVKDAKKAIKEAYHSIRQELDPDNYGVVCKSRDNSFLSYDASRATVITDNSPKV